MYYTCWIKKEKASLELPKFYSVLNYGLERQKTKLCLKLAWFGLSIGSHAGAESYSALETVEPYLLESSLSLIWSSMGQSLFWASTCLLEQCYGSQRLFFVAQDDSLAQVMPFSGLESHIPIAFSYPKTLSHWVINHMYGKFYPLIAMMCVLKNQIYA